MSTATANIQESEKKIYAEVKDKETGELTKIPIRHAKTEIHIMTKYDVGFSFSKTAKAKEWTDSRDDKKVSKAFIEQEMLRILGKEKTDEALKQLEET